MNSDYVEALMDLPAGYRFTVEAQRRIDCLALALNRRERRALLAHYRRNPCETLERIPPGEQR